MQRHRKYARVQRGGICVFKKYFVLLLASFLVLFSGSAVSVVASENDRGIATEFELQKINYAVMERCLELDKDELSIQEFSQILIELELSHLEWQETGSSKVVPRFLNVGADFINSAVKGNVATTELHFLYAWSPIDMGGTDNRYLYRYGESFWKGS